MRRCTSVAEELLPGHRAAPPARPISRLHPSVRPSVHPLSFCLTPVTFSICSFSSSLPSSVLPQQSPPLFFLFQAPPRVGVLRKGRGVEGAQACPVRKLLCNCIKADQSWRELLVSECCLLTGDWKLKWLKVLKLFLFLNRRFGSLAVRMLSTGKTAWCVWALLALLPLPLTQAQTQGKSLLILVSFLDVPPPAAAGSSLYWLTFMGPFRRSSVDTSFVLCVLPLGQPDSSAAPSNPVDSKCSVTVTATHTNIY